MACKNRCMQHKFKHDTTSEDTLGEKSICNMHSQHLKTVLSAFSWSFSSRATDIPEIFLSDTEGSDACVPRHKGGTVLTSLKIGYEDEIIFS